jgi:hypothetical protein
MKIKVDINKLSEQKRNGILMAKNNQTIKRNIMSYISPKAQRSIKGSSKQLN